MKKQTTRRSPPVKKETLGRELIRGLSGLHDALATGTPLQKRFTMRTVELRLDLTEWTADDIRALRTRLQVSQSVFAKLIGASVKTVQAWEQGHPPPPMARRLLECIHNDPTPWERMLRHAETRRSAA